MNDQDPRNTRQQAEEMLKKNPNDPTAQFLYANTHKEKQDRLDELHNRQGTIGIIKGGLGIAAFISLAFLTRSCFSDNKKHTQSIAPANQQKIELSLDQR